MNRNISLGLIFSFVAAFANSGFSQEMKPEIVADPINHETLKELTYSSADKAAISFVNQVRRFRDADRVEYCAKIIEKKSGGFALDFLGKGTPDGCSFSAEKNRDAAITAAIKHKTVGTVHTHPFSFGALDLSASGQFFSEQDLNFANSPISISGQATYLGGPAGQVLKYLRGSSSCRGDFVKHRYDVIQEPMPNAYGAYIFESDKFVYIKDSRSQVYCKRD